MSVLYCFVFTTRIINTDTPLNPSNEILVSERGRYSARHIKQRRAVLMRTALCCLYMLAEIGAPLSHQNYHAVAADAIRNVAATVRIA